MDKIVKRVSFKRVWDPIISRYLYLPIMEKELTQETGENALRFVVRDLGLNPDSIEYRVLRRAVSDLQYLPEEDEDGS